MPQSSLLARTERGARRHSAHAPAPRRTDPNKAIGCPGFDQLLITCLMVLLAASTRAEAQGIAHSFSELRRVVMPGDTVSVTGTNGAEVTGRPAEISSSALTLTVNGRPRDLRGADIVTIRQDRGDSLQNGAVIGLGVGAGLMFARLALGGVDGEIGWAAGQIAWSAALGAGLGAGQDALIPTRKVIYQRQGVRASVSF